MKGTIVAFNGHGLPLTIEEHNVRAIEPEEILVRNLYTTLCGSDLHTYSGARKELCPTVLGHEIVGEIMEIGAAHSSLDDAGNPLRVGDRITWSVFASDADCRCGQMGMPQKGNGLFKYGHAQVTEADAFHGGLATSCVLRKGTAVLKVPGGMPLSVAATLNCAIATVSGAMRLAGDVKGRRVLVTGLGLLGITAVAMCREAGAETIVVADVNDDRLRLARRFGADETINFLNLSQEDRDNATRRFDIALDMSGAPDAIEYGLRTLDTGGITVWVGSVFSTRPITLDAEMMVRQMLTIKGLHNYNYEDFRHAVSFMANNWNRYPFLATVEKEFALEAAEEAFQYALQHKPIRVGVRINP
jgi:alcohol dehydrogenase